MTSRKRCRRAPCARDAIVPFLIALSSALGEVPCPAQDPAGGAPWIASGQWLLLGPLGNDLGCDPGAAAASSWIAPQGLSSLWPSDGDPLTLDPSLAAGGPWRGVGDVPVWLCLGGLGLPDDGLVDLGAAVDSLAAQSGASLSTDDSVAVLVTYVTNLGPAPLPVRLCTASDGSLQVWVNDRKAQEVLACRVTSADCADEAYAVLVPGPNAIKVLLWHGSGDWSFRLGLRYLDGGPVSPADVQYEPGCASPAFPGWDTLEVSRALSTDPPGCPAAPGDPARLTVTLRAEHSDGPTVTVTERIENLAGSIAVGGIEAGGVWQEIPRPEGAPVGLFDSSADIGRPCLPGSTWLDPRTGTYTVQGSGEDIWTTGDQFQYAYEAVAGDFDAVARVAGRDWAPDTRWGKAGIMARQSFSPRARYSMIQTHGKSGDDADRFAARRTQGGDDTFDETLLAPGEHRDWMRLNRKGSVFTGYLSADGSHWTAMGSLDWGPAAPRTVLVGLAVCSRDLCRAATISFDWVRITGGGAPPGPLFSDGGTIVWRDVLRPNLEAGLRYTLAGSGLVALRGDDGVHRIEGPAAGAVYGGTSPAGIFDAAYDIGALCFPGSTVFQDGSYRLRAGGKGLGAGGDELHFAGSAMRGDFSLRAHVASHEWLKRSAKGGLIARESCDPAARYSLIGDAPDPDGAAFETRRASGSEAEASGAGGHPAWLRLDRVGSVFTGFTSEDGIAWTLRGREAWDPPPPETVLAGLALTSHADCSPAAMTFDGVSLEPLKVAVTRSAGGGECPGAAGDGLLVRLSGSAPPGPDVTVREEVHGAVEVTDVSDGGVVIAPQHAPAGEFTDSRDVGLPCAEGSTALAPDGSYRIAGAGDGLGAAEGDSFRFAYVEAWGDFSLTVRIASRSWVPASRGGRAGILARQDLDPLSRFAGVVDPGEDPRDPTGWTARSATGARDISETSVLGPWEHHDWLRLERVGSTIIGSSSADGVDWVEEGREEWIGAPATVLVGLAVTSGVACSSAEFAFDRLDFRGTRGDPAPLPGTTVVWSASSETLASGIGYRLARAGAGGGAVRFRGMAGGADIAGDDAAEVSAVQALAGPPGTGPLALARDIGGPCLPGSTVADAATGSYAVTGSGAGCGQGDDRCQFAWREVEGNYFIAIARIAERRWAPGARGQAGIVAREDCSPRARYVMMEDDEAPEGACFSFRAVAGESDAREVRAAQPAGRPAWLRLDRQGSLLWGSTSDDGETWRREGTVDLGPDAPPRLSVGLAVSSGAGCRPATVVFDRVKVQTHPNYPPTACIVTDPSPPLVSVEDGAAAIVLDGSCSSDSDGEGARLSFSWEQVTGPAASAFDDPEAAVTGVRISVPGSYVYRLTVDDGQVERSAGWNEVQVTAVAGALPLFRRGDADGSGRVDITDAIFILSYLFLGGAVVECPAAADSNGSGRVDITDAIHVLSWLYLGGGVPPAPGPFACGTDPTVHPGDCFNRGCE